MKIAICDDDKQELIQIRQLVDEYLSCGLTGDKLEVRSFDSIPITNRCTDPVRFVDDRPVSTEENHGRGTKSIAAVVEKYGGVYSFTAEDGVFKTSIIL